MNWIYFSPHLDDVALSCGGLVWEQTHSRDQVSVWTICAGDPPPGKLSKFAESLHERWQTGSDVMLQRRREDINSCAELGAAYRHFFIPDCIYRRSAFTVRESANHPEGYLYASESAIFEPLHPDEEPLVQQLSEKLDQSLPAEAKLVCPLALGGHVDHRLTRMAAEHLARPIWYYADYPYVLRDNKRLEELRSAGWMTQRYAISENGLQAWQQAVAAHQSQISTFWSDLTAMQHAIESYLQSTNGNLLWQPGGSASS